MPPAARSILEAVERTAVAEDRLTEALACVGAVNRPVAVVLLQMADLDARPDDRLELRTNASRRAGAVSTWRSPSTNGMVRSGLLWVEVKAGAAYQELQLEDYAREVRDAASGHPDGRVLTIVPPGTTAPAGRPGEPDWAAATWGEVASRVNRLGVGWRGSRWRHSAMRPDAPALWRYAAELVTRLEQMGYARVEPLSPEDIIAAQRIVALPRTIEALVRAVAAKQPAELVTATLNRSPRGATYQHFDVDQQRAWFDDPERLGQAFPELYFNYRDDWLADPRHSPAFSAGITFLDASEATKSALNRFSAAAQLPAGVALGGTGSTLRLVRTKYLAELVVQGKTLDEQADALSRWTTETFRDLFALDGNQPPPADSRENLADSTG